MLRSVGTGSEGLTISPWLQVAFLLTSAQHCVVLLFVACLPFLRNVRRCRGAACCHCCREMPTVHGHSSSHGDILSVGGKTLSLGEVLFQPGTEIFLSVGCKRVRWRKCCSSPGQRHLHCWQQTRPFRGHNTQSSVRSVRPSNAISFCVQSTRASWFPHWRSSSGLFRGALQGQRSLKRDTA